MSDTEWYEPTTIMLLQLLLFVLLLFMSVFVDCFVSLDCTGGFGGCSGADGGFELSKLALSDLG